MQIAHVVVDGSNIATEGRSRPSLEQLDKAVKAFMKGFDVGRLSVVVDATFGHRIDKSERGEFDEAIANNELVTPPAGAVGRGDAFVLEIAGRVDAVVLSNDSFQEFQSEHDWLFDEGRLIGGKPVPEVGWVFVPRVPVRAPGSRRPRRRDGGSNRGGRDKSPGKKSRPASSSARPKPTSAGEQPRGNPSDVASRFASLHAVGDRVNGRVDQFASHGAYVAVDDARCYVPLAAMDRPPPRSAKEILARGEERTFVVDGIDHSTGEIDLAIEGFEQSESPGGSDVVGAPQLTHRQEENVAPPKKTTTKKKSTKRKATKKKAPAKKKATKKTTKRKATTKKKSTARKTTKKKAPAKKKTTTKKKAASKR